MKYNSVEPSIKKTDSHYLSDSSTHSLLTHPSNTPFQHGFLTHPTNTSYQHTLWRRSVRFVFFAIFLFLFLLAVRATFPGLFRGLFCDIVVSDVVDITLGVKKWGDKGEVTGHVERVRLEDVLLAILRVC